VPGYLTIHIMEGRVPRLGMVLVDGSGHTLYAFLSDKKRSVTCVGTCTAVWRPITLRAEQALDSNPSLDDKLLGGDPGPNGRRVVTFGGWPLYTYTGDTQAGTATGQNTYSYGGRWSAILPSGALAAGTFVHLAR
jgi:predicted lipoprotein with Yx(FWY)xxD motif